MKEPERTAKKARQRQGRRAQSGGKRRLKQQGQDTPQHTSIKKGIANSPKADISQGKFSPRVEVTMGKEPGYIGRRVGI